MSNERQTLPTFAQLIELTRDLAAFSIEKSTYGDYGMVVVPAALPMRARRLSILHDQEQHEITMNLSARAAVATSALLDARTALNDPDRASTIIDEALAKIEGRSSV